jgi:hypothetical protein
MRALSLAADYWNNEIAMRFGTRLYRLRAAAVRDVRYRHALRDAVRAFQKSHAAWGSGQAPLDIIDLSDFVLPGDPYEDELASGSVLSACKRYIEGALRGEVREPTGGGTTPQITPTQLMTHRPSLTTRLRDQTFAPRIGSGPDTTVTFLVPPGRYELPRPDQAALPWRHVAPQSIDTACIQRVAAVGIYWQDRPKVLPFARGDVDRYWPSYRPERDRYQGWAVP